MSDEQREVFRGEVCDDLRSPGVPDKERLVERMAHCLQSDLQRFAMRRCGNGPDAEDAVQEALTVALRYVDGFRGETSLRSWMLRLVSSACTRQRRGRQNDPKLHTSLDPQPGERPLDLPDPALPPEQRLLVEEKMGKMVAALAALPEEERLLLLRHEGDGVSLASLAEENKQSIAAVRSKLYRVRRRLRTSLEQMMESPVPA